MGRLASALLLLLLVPACLDLEQDIACGDGHLEPAFEECDPGVPSSYENLCDTPSREATCVVPSCEIDRRTCDPPCGNGLLDEGEECDPNGTSFTLDALEGGGQLCTSTPVLDGGRPYEGGIITGCNDDCRWDRTPCHRCGNDEIDDGEVCEATDDNITAFDDACFNACIKTSFAVRPERVWCNAVCDECQGYAPMADPECCIPSGLPKHSDIPCCDFEEDDRCVQGLGGG